MPKYVIKIGNINDLSQILILLGGKNAIGNLRRRYYVAAIDFEKKINDLLGIDCKKLMYTVRFYLYLAS